VKNIVDVKTIILFGFVILVVKYSQKMLPLLVWCCW